METPIGRCSLCSGTVVRDESIYTYPHPPKARCTSCGAAEAPPARVIEMVKPLTQQGDMLRGLQDYYQHQLAERQKGDPVVQKPCPKCGPVLTQFIGQNSIVG